MPVLLVRTFLLAQWGSPASYASHTTLPAKEPACLLPALFHFQQVAHTMRPCMLNILQVPSLPLQAIPG